MMRRKSRKIPVQKVLPSPAEEKAAPAEALVPANTQEDAPDSPPPAPEVVLPGTAMTVSPEESTDALAEAPHRDDESAAEAEDASDSEIPDAPASPDEAGNAAEPDSSASGAASEPLDPESPTEPPAQDPAPEAAVPVKKRRILHPLWRGWWLAVMLLGIAVLMGNIDVFGAAWRRQPWRAFGGAIAAGGFLGALPGWLKGQAPERPRLRRCLLGLLLGAVWGVLG